MSVQDVKVFLLAVMGVHEFNWMKRFADEDLRSYDQQSHEEYGFPEAHQSPTRLKNSPVPVFREQLGQFKDLNDGCGLRFLLTDEEITWV